MIAAWVLAALWVGWLVSIVVRFLGSRSLRAFPELRDGPSVSVIVPARDEAHNIARCVRSLLASRYERFEVIVVDDQSTDGTGAIVRELAASDAAQRVRVLDAPPLPAGWFGKQWACHTGAQVARGELLLFTDADTMHGPELLGRCVSAVQTENVGLFTVAGRQEMVTFWEKVMQPFVFSFLLSRYGNLDRMSRARSPKNRIANGQYLLFTRTAYTALGGHEAVRAHVAEDMRLAALTAERAVPMQMVLGREDLCTRMYTSFGEIWRGWRKNVWAAGRDTFPSWPWAQVVIRVFYPTPAALSLAPFVALVLGLLGVGGPALLTFGIVAESANLLFWIGVYRFSQLNPLWALLHPVAAVVFGAILGQAAWRGSAVSWKGRAYESVSP